ncbi:MAG: helix-turn-helix transcriptional regulator [Clostridia bacterium]|nr:helix-turn-helix transcriptional regulator [Clostridia bacterium]
MDVKARLQQLMDERGWTIYRLAKEADIPWSTVRNMFKRNTEPSITTLESICRGMGLTLPQFFDEDNQMGLTPEQRQLIQQWSKLNKNERTLIQALVDALNEKA